MISGTRWRERISRGLERRVVVVLSGPRQVGKTTLACLASPGGLFGDGAG